MTTTRGERDYKLLDAGRSFAYKHEKKDLAEKLGYKYITEAVEDLYLNYGVAYSANVFEMSEPGFCQILKYVGVVMDKMKRGGRRVSADGLNEDMVRKAKYVWDGCSVDARYIEELKVVLGVHVSNNCMRSMLRGETWADV